MADVSIGSVSLGMQLDKADLLSQMKDITQSAASMLQNGLSNALRMGNTNVDMSGILGGIGEVKTEVKALSTMISAVIEKGMSTGAKDGVAAVTAAVSTVKMPTVKVTATKDDLTNQLDNMVALLDNTNAQIYTQQQLVDELKRKWAAMGNLGAQDSDVGLKMKKSILVAEEALIGLEGKSDTMVIKTRAMENAISNFGTDGAQAVKKIVAAATSTDKKMDDVGNAASISGKKIASGMNSASKSVKNLSSASLSATGLEKRLSSIERNVEKTTRSVTALGRRFLVLFVGKLISAAFKDITASLTGASEKSDTLKKSLNSLTSAGRTISNGVVTAIAPLINIVAPALSNVSEMIRVFSNRVAMFFAAVSGQSTVVQAKKSFAAYTAGATSAGNAAEKAQKQMAGFDDLNVLPSASASSSGGSGGSGGTNADDFETVGTVGSDLATKVKKAIDTMLPQLTAFWDDVLVPLGKWTLTDGLPMLADGLENIAQFFDDNPQLVDNLALFLASLIPLSALGPTALVIGITVQASIAAVEWLGGRDLGDDIKTVFDKKSWTDAGVTPGDWLVDGILHGFITSDTWADGRFFDKYVDWLMKTFDVDQLGGLGMWAEIGTNIAIGMLNGLIDTWNYFSDPIEQMINEGLAAPGKDPIDITLNPLDTKNYYKSLKEAEKSTNKWETMTQRGYAQLAAIEKGYVSATGTTIKTGTRDQSRTYQDYLYGLTTKTGAAYETVKSTVNLGTKGAANYLIGNTAGGVNTALGAYRGMPTSVLESLSGMSVVVNGKSGEIRDRLIGNTAGGVNIATSYYAGMPTSVSARMAEMAWIVSAKSNETKDSLAGMISAGTNSVVGSFSGMSNSATIRMLQMAQNSRLALLNILDNMGLLPTRTDKDSVTTAKTKILGGRLTSLPMFANGGYVGANSPQLAIIGDNKREGEIVAPESKIAEAVAAGIAAAGGGGTQTINITVQSVLDGKIIAESTTKYQAKKARQSNKPVFA